MPGNPYEPPAAVDLTLLEVAGCWRDGKDMVLTEDSALPDACVYCCNKLTKQVRRKFVVQPPTNLGWTILLAIVGTAIPLIAIVYETTAILPPLFLLVVTAVVFFSWISPKHLAHPRLEIAIPICGRHRLFLWLPFILIGTYVLVLGLAILGIELYGAADLSSLVFWALIFAFALRPPNLTAKSHASGKFWIRGSSEKYLDLLPSWREQTESSV